MTIDEQKKMVEEEKANAKTNRIISILFVAAFCAAPVGVGVYQVYDFLKTEHEAKVKKQQQQEEEAKAKKTLSLAFVNTRQK